MQLIFLSKRTSHIKNFCLAGRSLPVTVLHDDKNLTAVFLYLKMDILTLKPKFSGYLCVPT